MVSAIDATQPPSGNPTTAAVRNNFATAKSEISALQSSTTANLNLSSTNTQPTTDYIHNEISGEVSYTSNGTSGDTLSFVSYIGVQANGHTVPNTASQHTCAIYGNGSLLDTGTVYQVIGVMGVSGNSGAGTLANGVDFFGHANYNTGGGTISNHYFLYQESSAAATHEYGAYFSAPVGIGIQTPTYDLQVYSSAGGNILAGNWMQIGSTTGQFSVTSTGASFYPGYNPGAGGLGVQDLVVGNNGTAEATSSTGSFLYISSCPGTPTGIPTQAAVGRIPMRYDTAANKLWIYNGGWKSAQFA